MIYSGRFMGAFMILVAFGCTEPEERPGLRKAVTYTYKYPVWHFALADSFDVSMDVDTAFHPSPIISSGDDHTASFSLESKHSIVTFSYYALTAHPAEYAKDLDWHQVGKDVTAKIKDAYSEHIVEPYNSWQTDLLEGVSVLSYDLSKKEVYFTGGNRELCIEFHITITSAHATEDPEEILQQVLKAFKFVKK